MSAASCAPRVCARRAKNSSPAAWRRRTCARSRTNASARSSSAQENVGLKGITDGEFRRTYFHVDFLEKLDGVETHYGEFVAKFRKDDGSEVGFKPPTMHVEGKIKHVAPIQGADFDFLKGVDDADAESLHPRAFDAAFPRRPRGDQREGLSAARGFLRRSDRRLSRRGRRSRQRAAAAICSSTTPISPISAIPAIRERTKARGDDPDALVRLYCKLVNDSIRDRPEGHDDLGASVPRQFQERLGRAGRLRAGRRNSAQRDEDRRLLPRIRRRALRRFRAAALHAEGRRRSCSA